MPFSTTYSITIVQCIPRLFRLDCFQVFDRLSRHYDNLNRHIYLLYSSQYWIPLSFWVGKFIDCLVVYFLFSFFVHPSSQDQSKLFTSKLFAKLFVFCSTYKKNILYSLKIHSHCLKPLKFTNFCSRKTGKQTRVVIIYPSFT